MQTKQAYPDMMSHMSMTF